jgi:carnitine O-acetyltransferase
VDDSSAASDDEGLGGCKFFLFIRFERMRLIQYTDGFFDAGMLLQALKARDEALDDGSTKASERATVNARRREIGKKLRLSEY